MKNKVENIKKEARLLLERYNNPIVLCSFGKDSMVMLHILLSIQKMPIIHHRIGNQFDKYKFADEIIEKWELERHDYLPTTVDIMCAGKNFDAIGMRHLGKDGWAYVAHELRKPENGNFDCALKTFISHKTIPSYDYGWDITFIGNKNNDPDSILGQIKIKKGALRVGNTILSCPIRTLTDDDIWEYTEKYNVPYNDKRYDKDNGYKEFDDKTYNENYHFCCTDCVNPNLKDKVMCPLLKDKVENISSKMNYDNKLGVLKNSMTYIDFGGN